MTKKKAAKVKPKAKPKVEEATGNLCPSCLKKGIKVTMTPKGINELECPKCYSWMKNPGAAPETREQEVARLKARLTSLEAQ